MVAFMCTETRLHPGNRYTTLKGATIILCPSSNPALGQVSSSCQIKLFLMSPTCGNAGRVKKFWHELLTYPKRAPSPALNAAPARPPCYISDTNFSF
ncbi:Uncharacterised protein [Corynebacterium diphtheriae bv. mitis]|nr:Uncharacterised protein [Corynebacterium diphtheriae bv. mitis]